MNELSMKPQWHSSASDTFVAKEGGRKEPRLVVEQYGPHEGERHISLTPEAEAWLLNVLLQRSLDRPH